MIGWWGNSFNPLIILSYGPKIYMLIIARYAYKTHQGNHRRKEKDYRSCGYPFGFPSIGIQVDSQVSYRVRSRDSPKEVRSQGMMSREPNWYNHREDGYCPGSAIPAPLTRVPPGEARWDGRDCSGSINGLSNTQKEWYSIQRPMRMEKEEKDLVRTRYSVKRSPSGRLFSIREKEKRSPVRCHRRLQPVRVLKAPYRALRSVKHGIRIQSHTYRSVSN